MWMLWLWACAQGPTLTSVEPNEVHPGDELVLIGERFSAAALPFVVSDADPAPVALEVGEGSSPGRVAARIPLGLEPGRYTVGVREGSRDALLPVGLVVAPAPVDTPCSGDYTTNTQLSLAQKRVVIDRFHRNGERQTIELGLDEVVRVGHSRPVDPARGRCDAIWLHTKDGRRLLFDDDAVVDLEPRARRVADSMSRPFASEPEANAAP